MGLEKAVATIGAFVVGVFLINDTDVSGLVEIIGGTVLVATPIVVAWVKNGHADTIGYGKLLTALPAAVIGVGLWFGVDVSGTVNDVASLFTLALPVLVWAVPGLIVDTAPVGRAE